MVFYTTLDQPNDGFILKKSSGLMSFQDVELAFVLIFFE